MDRKWLFGLVLILLGACTPAAPDEPTVTEAALTTAPTNTLAPSPTITATPSPIPTRAVYDLEPIAFSTPSSDESSAYQLRAWSAEQADIFIAQILTDILSLEEEFQSYGVYGQADFLEIHQYAAFAAWEALIRYPLADQSIYWHWDLCYYLALSHMRREDPNAPELACYADLIASAINAGEVDVEGLESWFTAHEDRLLLTVHVIDPNDGSPKKYLIELDDGPAYLLLSASENGVEVYGLISNLFYFREASGSFQISDLTGDGVSELVLDFSSSGCCGFLGTSYIYAIANLPPGRLPIIGEDWFDDSIYGENSGDFYPAGEEGDDWDFEFRSYLDLYHSPCPYNSNDKYHWNGAQFEFVGRSVEMAEPYTLESDELCYYALEEYNDPKEVEILPDIFSLIKYSRVPVENQIDELRYRVGEYHLRVGNVEKAFDIFGDLLTDPAYPEDDKYVVAAKFFLDNYQSPDDYYRLCTQVEVCDHQGALRQLVANIPVDNYLALEGTLQAAGIDIRSSDLSNFDGLEFANIGP